MSTQTKRTILLVEDESAFAFAQAETLRTFGFDVIVADSGENALQLALGDGTISLILMDIDLGIGMDGTETARRILEKRALPIVFLTSHSEQEMVERVQGITRYGYVTKNSGEFVLRSSIEMAFELFEVRVQLGNELSERKQAEQALRLSEERFRVIALNSPDHVLVQDHELRYRFVLNPQLGLTEADMIGRTDSDLLSGEEAENLTRLKRTILETGEPVRISTMLRNRRGENEFFEGSYVPKRDASGKVDGLIGYFRNVTDQKRVESQREATLEDLRIHQVELSAQNEELRRLQIELDATRARYFDLYDMAPVGYLSVSEEGKILESNFTAATMLALPRSALVNKPILRFVHNEDHDVYYLRRTALLETGTPQVWDQRMERNDGTVFWASLETALAKGPDGAPECRIVMSDITERKRVAEELQRKEEYLSLVYNNSDIGIFVVDVAGGGQYVYRGINPTHERLMGITNAQVVGRSPESLTRYFNPETVDYIKALYDECVRKRKIIESEYYVPAGFAQGWWLSRLSPIMDNRTGKVTGLMGSALNITVRKQLEEALRTERDFSKSISQLSPVGITKVDRDGHILYANAHAEAILGLSRTDILALSYNSPTFAITNIHGGKFPEEQLPFQQVRARLQPVRGIQHAIALPEGEKVILSINAVPLFDESGHFDGMIASIEDITERRESEEMLRELADRLRSIREEESTRIAREIHDELGQALSGLKMELSFMPESEKKESILSLVDGTIGSVRRICTELRPVILDSLGLAAAIEWGADNFQQKTGIRCICGLQTDEDPGGDEGTAIFRIFQESLTNVLRHAKASEVNIRYERDGRDVVLTVFDNGVGIRPDQVANHMALGLLGIRERAKSFGGVATIEGFPGKGTRVTVRMPL